MEWVYYALLGAAILHVLEEYLYPGGFPTFMKMMVPTLGPFITMGFSVTINVLFLGLCLTAALVGQRIPVFGLSVAGLCGLNGLAHALGVIRSKHYVPGVLTGILLYFPLTILAYHFSIRVCSISILSVAGSILLSVVYQAVPFGTLMLARSLRRV